jgi:hypothetical protein
MGAQFVLSLSLSFSLSLSLSLTYSLFFSESSPLKTVVETIALIFGKVSKVSTECAQNSEGLAIAPPTEGYIVCVGSVSSEYLHHPKQTNPFLLLQQNIKSIIRCAMRPFLVFGWFAASS